MNEAEIDTIVSETQYFIKDFWMTSLTLQKHANYVIFDKLNNH